MAGASFNITYHDAEVLTVLGNLVGRMQNMHEVYADIGEHLLNSHKARWSSAQAPDGTAWAPLDPAYKAGKQKNADKILVLDGDLKDLLHYQATDDELQLGTGLIYGATHQLGAPDRGIPARPFLGISDQDRTDVLEILHEYLADVVNQ